MDSDSATSGPWPARHPFAGVSMTPLFQAACLYALGIAAARKLWIPPSHLLVSLLLLALLSACSARFTLRLVWLPVSLLWILLGAWCAEMEVEPQPSKDLALLSDGLLRTIEGTITTASPVRHEVEQDVDDPVQARERYVQRVEVRFTGVEVITDATDEIEPMAGGARLTLRWTLPPASPFSCGQRIRADVRLLQPETYHDAGAWNSAEYLASRGITATGAVDATQPQVLPAAPSPRSLSATLESLRCAFSNAQRIASSRIMMLPALTANLPAVLRMNADDAVVLAAMITGDRTSLTHSLRAGFERTGSFHMLVVSGFHLAIVAGTLFWICGRLRLPRVPGTFVTIVASFAYAFFTGFATPVQRSLAMVVLYLLGRLIFRQRSLLNVIGFAALCLLVVSPRSLFDAGFQMTLLAVVSIAGIARPLLNTTLEPLITATRDLGLIGIDVKLPPRQAQFRVLLRMFAQRLRMIFNRFVGWRLFPFTIRFVLRCAELIVVSLVVELAMTLPMAADFHRVTLVALPVNVLILPLLFVLVPAALVTLLVLWIWPVVSTVPAAITALLLHTGVFFVRALGSFAAADLRIPTPTPACVLLFCCLLAFAVVIAGPTRKHRMLSCVALTCGALCAVAPQAIRHPHDALFFEAIDVGQGDSLLLITPEGKTLLVDGGGFGAGPFAGGQDFDIGEEVVSAALWSRGIRRLDAVALTHAHADHIGGLPAVLRNFHPRELWVGNNPSVRPYTQLLAEAATVGTRTRVLRAGDMLQLGSVGFHVLAPFASYAPGPAPSNNDSLVLRASYKTAAVLLEGDAESPVETAMLAEPGLSSTLLKVGHHGSLTSSTPDFLSRVAPRFAIISCGLRNRYGHPRQEVLEELQAAHIGTYSTDVNGAVCFRLNGVNAVPDPGCP